MLRDNITGLKMAVVFCWTWRSSVPENMPDESRKDSSVDKDINNNPALRVGIKLFYFLWESNKTTI